MGILGKKSESREEMLATALKNQLGSGPKTDFHRERF